MTTAGEDSLYGARAVKRFRRTDDELDVLDAAIMTAARLENPASLRALFYRVMSAGAVEKTERGYRTVGRQVLKLRRAGVMPYSWVTDGTRYVTQPRSWDSADDAIESTARLYRRRIWVDQGLEIHVFSEKNALVGVLEPATRRWDVPLGVLRGYASESFCWKVAESVKGKDKAVHLFQFGDHDPSGVNAWADFERKVRDFAPRADLHFKRLAVTSDQIRDMKLPTRPTKTSDTRAKKFGTGGSVEVDAIPPTELRRFATAAIEGLVDMEQYRLTKIGEDSERTMLGRVADHLDDFTDENYALLYGVEDDE